MSVGIGEDHFKSCYVCPSCGKTFFGFESMNIDFQTGWAECPECKQQGCKYEKSR